MRTAVCRNCGEDIIFHCSQRTGKYYPCNSSDHTDFHKCKVTNPCSEVPIGPAQKCLAPPIRSEAKEDILVGALMVFLPGVSLAHAKRAIANSPKLLALLDGKFKNAVTGDYDAPAQVEEFNPAHGCPVFYIP